MSSSTSPTSPPGVSDIGQHESWLSQTRAREFSRWLMTNNYQPRVLADVGCRCGYALMIFADELPATKLLGVDILPEAAMLAQNYADETYVADMTTRLPFEDHSIDWVFCSHTLEHLHDIPAGISELARVAKYGMHIVVPLESDAKFAYYKGKTSPDGDAGMHQFHTMDPLVWLKMFDGRDLILRTLYMSLAHSDIRFTLMHAAHLVYGGNVYS